jgi:hypothetical protein
MSKTNRFKKFNLTDLQLQLLDSIECNDYKKLRRFVQSYIDFGIDFTILKQNWGQISSLGNDSSSLHSFKIRYGDIKGVELWEIKTKKCITTKDMLVEKYGEETATNKLRRNGASLEIYKERYGEVDGILKWNHYCEKRRNTYIERQGTYIKRNLDWFIEKHGQEKGYEIWNNKRKSQAYKVSLEYYIDMYGENEGREKIKKCKARGVEFYIKKYGMEDGIKRYESHRLKTSPNKFTASKWSLECVAACNTEIGDLYFYGKNEMVWNLPTDWQIKMNQKCISPDLFYKGKIIEFHGNLFHANPNMFCESDTPNPFRKKLTSAEIWKKDSLRKNYYLAKGYTIMEIWEEDFKNDKEGIIKKCINFLK